MKKLNPRDDEQRLAVFGVQLDQGMEGPQRPGFIVVREVCVHEQQAKRFVSRETLDGLLEQIYGGLVVAVRNHIPGTLLYVDGLCDELCRGKEHHRNGYLSHHRGASSRQHRKPA